MRSNVEIRMIPNKQRTPASSRPICSKNSVVTDCFVLVLALTVMHEEAAAFGLQIN